jgi:hypothetical protein
MLKPARGEQDRAQRITDVVTDDRQDPFFEVVSERELTLTALLLRILRPAPLVDVDTAPDEPAKFPASSKNGTPRSNIQRYRPSWRRSRYSVSKGARC